MFPPSAPWRPLVVVGGVPLSMFPPSTPWRPLVVVGGVAVVDVARQHVVVHVDGATVVDGVAEAVGHDGLTRVGRQAQLEEAGL